jgi:hypothetical protein
MVQFLNLIEKEKKREEECSKRCLSSLQMALVELNLLESFFSF